jgi:rhodanese-related sulfurtransferase
MGYTNVKVFAAGYPAWKKAYGAAPVQVKAGSEEGTIEIVTFEKIIQENPESILLIDVRDPDEFATGHFQTAVNMPVDELEKKVQTLPADKPIVFVCSTGARSGESYYMLQDIRPELKKVYYLEAGVEFNKDGSYKIVKTP